MLVCGIEAHVCVAQTTLDLIDVETEVHVAADAVGSRTDADREIGLARMERAGAETHERRDGAVRAARIVRRTRRSRKCRRSSNEREGYVLLEDGTRFDGELCGAVGEALGEVVFNTSMTGYQEAVTDPSYAGQIITFTYPMIGNYGVGAPAMESDRVQARAVIMREARNGEDAADAEGGWLDWLDACGVTAITGVDTRTPRPPHPRPGRDARRHLRRRRRRVRGARRGSRPSRRWRAPTSPAPSARGEAIEFDGDGPHIVALDTGIKLSIIRQFRERGAG